MTTALKTTVLADGRIELSGPTFEVREEIKAAAVAAGGKAMWDAGRKVWTVPAGTVVPVPKPKPREATGGAGGKASTSSKSREAWTREEWQVWIAAFKSRNRGRVERCCSAARDVGDIYGPSCYSCERHGETHGSYRGD
jgi:hypothetical protein